jgi:glycosyltransferase involved in cell wall biosynthesis
MPKVLHYKSNFLNYSETFIKRLIDHHQQFEPTGMCIHKQELTANFPVYEAPNNGMKGGLNTLCFHLNLMLPFYKETISTVKPDLIHAHFGYDGYRMIKPSKKLNVPLVVSFYGSDVSRLPSEFDWNRRYRKLAKFADQFIVISDRMKKQLIKLGFPKQKINVVRFGLDLDEFSFNPAHDSELPLMMAGRMVEKKGFRFALEAIKILSEQNLNVHLDLYGNGILRDKLERQASRGNISHLIHFKGRRPIDEIRKSFQTHSALLVPSVTASDGDREGIPNTLLEGMASGIPVIATDHSAIPEVIIHGENGLMTPEGDAETIAERIKIIKGEKINITHLRENARRKIEQEYELNRMVEEVEKIYLKVIGKR